MTRILSVVQEKGGVGKSTLARGLAEAVPDAPVFEIDASQRLVELGKRVRFFPMRASHEDIDRTGGRAARSEFDAVMDGIGQATLPTVIDIGANTAVSFLSALAQVAPDLHAVGIELGVLVVVTSEPGALAEGPRLMALAKRIASARFLVENQLHGDVDAKALARAADGAVVTRFGAQVMEEAAVEVLQGGGLASIPKLDSGRLAKLHGLALGARIRRDLNRFRFEAMQAVEPAARWLVG